MQVSEILQTLPHSLEWMVLFNISAIEPLTDHNTIKAMYHLPEDVDLKPYSHVVLTSEGRFLASGDNLQLFDPVSGKRWSKENIKDNLYTRFSPQLNLFSVDEADCLGLGEQNPYSPVLLHVKIAEGYGQAQAIFDHQPNFDHYPLLKAVGVKFLSGEIKNSYYLAKFQNRLPIHIHAGILSHFSRTAHCNLFFLQHGNIDPPLEEGLWKASEVRSNWGKNYNLTILANLVNQVEEKPLAMVCQPPPPQPLFGYGDLVPLGFVLRALNLATDENTINSKNKLEKFLLSKQEGKLWAFHSQRLVTATDSALVLQGFNLPESVEALEVFADGKGGYYPQLWSEEKQEGKMVYDDSCAHWCQGDYATTCMVRNLRKRAGLESKTPLDYLLSGFEHRSGLYFANPYLVDWYLAQAITDEEERDILRQKLITEILASINEDYSFGLYDVAFSTALAILTLTELGVRSRTIRVMQLRLLELMEAKTTLTIPFYSSLKVDSEITSQKEFFTLLMGQSFTKNPSGINQKQIRKIGEEYHGISLYLDTYRLITHSTMALALAEKCDLEDGYLDLSHYQDYIHPRYQCQSHCEYIAKFALPPYLLEGQRRGE
ncbi:hypothetical protein [Cyanobacterium aponinum]|uniref:Uncharacterized protein n=1 Tax=Cyanobacterium aponinum 0216 TaxID=2676140 RepID=A0A844H3I4_9CHRO|nr:hypothetical protein [Cyanobacterium aponinum]MTF40716.1 hypothetical protein [Cyanobacterium aponinum 0216]